MKEAGTILMDEAVHSSDEDRLNVLLKRLKTFSDLGEAAKEIVSLTETSRSMCHHFSNSKTAISDLLNPLLSLKDINAYSDLRENIVRVLINLCSDHRGNVQQIVEHPLVIPLLVGYLSCGSSDMQADVANAISMIVTSLPSKHKIIGEAGAVVFLVDLLSQNHEHPTATRDFARAIFNLCYSNDNMNIARNCGVVGVIFQKIKDGIDVDELLSLLARFVVDEGTAAELLALEAHTYLENFPQEAAKIIVSQVKMRQRPY